MSDTEFGCSGSTSCSPSDCASCAGGCGGSDISSHRTITLTMEDDTEVECAILTIFPVDAKEYIALLPLDESGQNTRWRGISLLLHPHRIRRSNAGKY